MEVAPLQLHVGDKTEPDILGHSRKERSIEIRLTSTGLNYTRMPADEARSLSRLISGITSAYDHLLRHRHVFRHSVVDELDADRPVILVEEDLRRRRVQHYVEIRTIPGGTQEGARRGESRAIPGRGLRYGEPGVGPSVQINRVVA